MGKLNGKTVLITGGSSGIGLASAKLFLEHGARLAITGRDPDGLARARDELGGDVLMIRSDTGNLAEIESLMQQVERHFTRLDVLFVNAAVAAAAPMELVSETLFDDIMRTNFKGAFFTIQKALPLFSAAASIIVTTSIANQLGSPNFSVYGASKAALRSLVQSLGLELVSRGIRINAISPGPIATPIFDRFGLPPDVADGIKAEIAQKSPSKRFGHPSEVAKVALFLASDDAAYVLGEEIVVDGGMSLL
ncbi:NAD(P)-dependent dehydrogenase (short-subunit alcohol dehydrogenase family) [Collimonas sp. PA-H2]|uniref:SDR family oxidoreductase n=1 Tax=Collimonas sp. PA-H2 TaxID=1881062 RepID=UPI000BF65ECB|nr:SDR family oxidoreductase [Collimonas sp. PA-H2]PFH12001.1 NAD(P)-dependent dehydrogenase (short-subunit alcohol dehydrogenase family) [Collimonas sp. PA-H2]